LYKTEISQVKPGMVIEQPVYLPGSKKILLTHGTILKAEMIKKLKAFGIQELNIADKYTLFVLPTDKMSIHLKESFYLMIRKYTSSQPAGNLTDSMISIIPVVKNSVDKICKNAFILDICMQMKIIKDNRLFAYSVLTSVFSGIIAGALGLEKEMYNIMTGALLHNIGTLEMAFLIGKKHLNHQENLLWKEHPTYGYYLAIEQNIPRNIAEIILHHHENWDGNGYPNQLIGEEIPIGARIISVCSTISNHIYFDCMQPYESIEYIYCSCNTIFDKRIVDAFVNTITLYPLGALVRLSTGEVGIIANVRKNKGPRPIINVCYNRVGKPLSEPHTVDLAKERTIFISEVLG
jgi:HD-GYP domain-containing protein (c-di-GMP phosphodiesterase class II)